MTKGTKKMNVNVNVNVEDINVDTLMKAVKTAQKKNSIWAEFGPDTAKVAILGIALQQKIYREENDVVLHMKIVFNDEQEKVRITTIRAFYRKDQETGENLPNNIAFRNAIQLVTNVGTKISKIHDVTENPNLSTFGWDELTKPMIVLIETRESNGRFWPNNVIKYEPTNINVNDIVASCKGDTA